jgi:GntR family transcriptional regulator
MDQLAHQIIMHITIDIDDPIPLFTQLIEQIKLAVANKHIAPGDPLPSIRQLASDLELNSKTVAKAYKLLERDSVIQTRGYRGTFVHPDAQANCSVDLAAWTNEILNTAIEQLRSEGVTDSEIRIAFTQTMNQANRY